MKELIKSIIDRVLRIDVIRLATALTGLYIFHEIGTALIHESIPKDNREIVINFIGIVEGAVLTLFQYEFGSSKDKKKPEA